MKTYPQQHEPWRPDYPQVWNILERGKLYDSNSDEVNLLEYNENLVAFATARNAIDKAMKS